LEKESQKSDFWQDKEKAIKITQEINKSGEEVVEFDKLKTELTELKTQEELEEFERKLKEKEFQVFLSGKYDKNNAILSIYAGAGGQDAQDWATILLRMYERYCQRKGFKTRVLSQSFGEGGGPEGRIGTKQVSLEIKGNFTYGFLKKENGVHRLVRISPFSPKALRHTSFALVEVIPGIPEPQKLDLKIRPEDLKTDFYRASGPGGQYVNKKETAVRVTHLPTGIQASCQSERFQPQNRKIAMEMLYSKLYQFLEESRQKELTKIKGKKLSASWGNQIRSYVLQPYQLVKDLRTGVETSNVEGVLDGELNQFIEAEIKIHD
jgi:peptide chain release factor 2